MKKNVYITIGCLIAVLIIGAFYFSNRGPDCAKIYKYEYSASSVGKIDKTYIAEITNLDVIKQVEACLDNKKKLGDDFMGAPSEYLVEFKKNDKVINSFFFHPSNYPDGAGAVVIKGDAYLISKQNNEALKGILADQQFTLQKQNNSPL